ncbi:unnamed protein product [Amoebophrya sp. A120]|nr:unnamed protein product [Amoebophrya sp. A120]|eukprot:GSA120T00008177001.1
MSSFFQSQSPPSPSGSKDASDNIWHAGAGAGGIDFDNATASSSSATTAASRGYPTQFSSTTGSTGVAQQATGAITTTNSFNYDQPRRSGPSEEDLRAAGGPTWFDLRIVEHNRRMLMQNGQYRDPQTSEWLQLYQRHPTFGSVLQPKWSGRSDGGGPGPFPKPPQGDFGYPHEQANREMRALIPVERVRLPPPGEQNPAACVVGGILPAILVGAVATALSPNVNFMPGSVRLERFRNFAGLFYLYTLLQCPFRVVRAHNVARIDSLTDHMIAGGTVGALAVHHKRLGMPMMKEIDVDLLLQRYPRFSRPQVAFFVYGHCAAFLHALALFFSGQFKH